MVKVSLPPHSLILFFPQSYHYWRWMFDFCRPKPKQKNDTNLRTVVVFRIQMKVAKPFWWLVCVCSCIIYFFTWWLGHYLFYRSLIMDNCLLTVFGYYKQHCSKHPSLGVVKNADIGVTTPGFESSLHVNSVNLSMLPSLCLVFLSTK